MEGEGRSMVQWVTRQSGQARAVDTDSVSDAVWHRVMEETSMRSLNLLFCSWREGGVCRKEFRTLKKMVRLMAAVKQVPSHWSGAGAQSCRRGLACVGGHARSPIGPGQAFLFL